MQNTSIQPQLRFPPLNQNMPTQGWHFFHDTGATAHIVPDQIVYQVRYFPPGYVTADNYERIGRQSERMAAAVFGTVPPPPSPQR